MAENERPGPGSPPQSDVAAPDEGRNGTAGSEWSLRLAGSISWPRILVVGTWLAVVASFLIWVEGPFWRDAADWFRQAQDAAARGEWSAAVENLQRAREAAPENAGLATFEGHMRLRLDEPEAAADAFGEARELAPEDVEPALGMAEARLELGDTAAARSSLDTAAQLSPNPSDRRRLASLAEAAGDGEVALESLLGPPPVGPPSDRIRLALRLERWPLATDLLRQTLSADPGSDLAPATGAERIQRRKELAWALESAGRDAEALAEYRTLASEDALDDETALRYAWLLDEAGRYAEARSVLDDIDDPGREVVELRIRTALWAGRIDEAEERLDRALAETPGDSALVALRGEVAAARERLAAARAAGRERAEAEARRRAEEEARARIARDTPPEDPEDALAFWRERLRRSPADSVARREAVALLESFERFDEAARVLRVGRDVEEISDPETLLHLARLGEWAGRPPAVIQWLGRYADLHGEPPRSARISLARAYREEGEEAESLRVYEALRSGGEDDPEIILAVAQLRAATGDFEGAGQAYRSYLAAEPEATSVRLAYARHLASTGQLDPAAEEYAAYREAGGEEPVALEVARVELGRERWGAAVPAARDAVREAEASNGSSSDAHWEARLVLAQALKYDGRRGEAEALLRTLSDRSFGERGGDPAAPPVGAGSPISLEAALWRAEVARLRDRPLEAVRVLESATSASGRSHGILAGAAMDAGLWARAGRALDEASEAGADSASVEALRERFRRATAPAADLAASLGSDDADLTRFQGGLAGDRWVAGERARIRATARSVVLSQASVREEIVALSAELDSLVLGDATFVGADIGLQVGSGDETTFSGGLRGVRNFEDGSSLGLRVDRAPLWEGERDLEPLRYSRIRNLATVGTELMETELEARGRKTLGIGRAALASAGLSWYSDGNRRAFAYGHLELPVQTRVGRWISLQPNAYAEWFDGQLAGYASPSRYLAAGVRAVGIWEGDRGSLEIQVNPHYFDDSVTGGLGVDAQARVARDVGPVEVSVRGFYLGQDGAYEELGAGLGVRWTPGVP